jgi:hypothetical protein
MVGNVSFCVNHKYCLPPQETEAIMNGYYCSLITSKIETDVALS